VDETCRTKYFANSRSKAALSVDHLEMGRLTIFSKFGLHPPPCGLNYLSVFNVIYWICDRWQRISCAFYIKILYMHRIPSHGSFNFVCKNWRKISFNVSKSTSFQKYCLLLIRRLSANAWIPELL